MYVNSRRMLCILLVTMSSVECPVLSKTLFAYPEGDTYVFENTLDPLIKTNIGLLDRLLTSDDEVRCTWGVTAKDGHYASVTIDQFHLSEASGSKEGDCLYIYEGNSATADFLLLRLCGGEEVPGDSVRSKDDRYLYVVFTQGPRPGYRSFSFTYKAVARSKHTIVMIAVTVSCVVAALGVFFLACKFTRGCSPCRKRCCPNDPHEPQGPGAQRELRPLTPPTSTLAAGRTAAGPPAFSRAEGVGGGGSRSLSREEERGGGGGDHQLDPPADEPPPSYASIYGHLDDRDKADP